MKIETLFCSPNPQIQCLPHKHFMHSYGIFAGVKSLSVRTIEKSNMASVAGAEGSEKGLDMRLSWHCYM